MAWYHALDTTGGYIVTTLRFMINLHFVYIFIMRLRSVSFQNKKHGPSLVSFPAQAAL